MATDYHLKLSLSGELWNEMLGAALPVRIAGDELHLARSARAAVHRLGLRQRVAGLLEDRSPPPAMLQLKDRAVGAWRRRRPALKPRIADLVRVEGEWRVEVDGVGTEMRCAHQRIAADAWLRGVAEGRIVLLQENVELPFRLERRIGASLALADIRYEPGHRAVLGSLQDLAVYAGDSVPMQLLSRLAEYALEQQLPRVNPVPILRRDQVEGLVAPMGGPLRMQMGVEDLALDVDDGDIVLKVRFGFTRKQLEDSEGQG